MNAVYALILIAAITVPWALYLTYRFDQHYLIGKIVHKEEKKQYNRYSTDILYYLHVLRKRNGKVKTKRIEVSEDIYKQVAVHDHFYLKD